MLIPNNIYPGDCFNLMPQIPDKSVDMILCDLPYGTTACKWDVIIPFDKLWEQYRRVCKDDAAVVLFGSEPFSSHLRLSSVRLFKYDWIWRKNKPSGMITAKIMPMKEHEIISVFSFGRNKYFPIKQKTKSESSLKNAKAGYINKGNFKSPIDGVVADQNKWNEMVNPRSVLDFDVEPMRKGRLHPTQKPIALCEYLIKTYTNENDLVLDNCMGSGTTCLAAKNVSRRWIGIEKDENYFNIARERLEKNEREGKKKEV